MLEARKGLAGNLDGAFGKVDADSRHACIAKQLRQMAAAATDVEKGLSSAITQRVAQRFLRAEGAGRIDLDELHGVHPATWPTVAAFATGYPLPAPANGRLNR